ncbi:ornithine decarboxylase-like [Rhipicephalus microplus]|uniref:ornithine decarboxylase-like n=1 Tax=Rhipicephalus microplus TaxID=6941 RepID=UPI003F6C83FB
MNKEPTFISSLAPKELAKNIIGNSANTADIVNKCLEKHFPESYNVTVISEPGGFVVSSAFSLYTKIIGKRMSGRSDGELRNEERTVGIDHGFLNFLALGNWGTENVLLGTRTNKESQHIHVVQDDE